MSKRTWKETDFASESSASKKQKTSHSNSKNINSNNSNENEFDLLDLVDEAEEIEALDVNTLQKTMKTLKEAIKKNEQQRSKFSNTPIKFRDSEIALNDVIQELSLKLPESPHLYRDFVLFKGCDYLLTLLMHENIDIVSTIIGFIKELTEADNYIESQSAIIFIVTFIQQKGIQILVQNLERLHDANIITKSDNNCEGKDNDDEEEDDSQTIFAVLSILENISEIDMDFCVDIVKQCKLFRMLLNGMRKERKKFDEIQLYLSELLCIYLQPMDDDMTIYEEFAKIKGCDKILDLLQYKYQCFDPILSEEKEYVCNLCDALSSSLASTVNQNKFNQSPNSMKILIILIKQKNYLKQGCLQALSFAVTNHQKNCIKLIENNGIKTIFWAFMNRKKIKKKYKKDHNIDKIEEYLCCIMVHLFCNLCDINLLRLINKFKEKDYEKIERLIELHAKYMTKLEDNDIKEKNQRIKNDIEKETFAERYARRLDNGLYILQMIDMTIAFIYTFTKQNNNEIKQRIIQVLNQCDMDIDQVKIILKEYYNVTHVKHENDNNNNNNNNNNDDDDVDDMSLGTIAGKLVNLME
eukprot:268360_1